MLCLLPDKLNPTLTKESRDRYLTYVAPCWIFSSLASASIFYGFNVYIIPTNVAFFGPDEVYSWKTSQITLAFTVALAMTTVVMFYAATRYLKIGARRLFIAGTVLNCLGVAMAGIAVRQQSLVGFWLSLITLMAMGSGPIWIVGTMVSVRW